MLRRSPIFASWILLRWQYLLIRYVKLLLLLTVVKKQNVVTIIKVSYYVYFMHLLHKPSV